MVGAEPDDAGLLEVPDVVSAGAVEEVAGAVPLEVVVVPEVVVVEGVEDAVVPAPEPVDDPDVVDGEVVPELAVVVPDELGVLVVVVALLGSNTVTVRTALPVTPFASVAMYMIVCVPVLLVSIVVEAIVLVAPPSTDTTIGSVKSCDGPMMAAPLSV